jgi:hypothetical protein
MSRNEREGRYYGWVKGRHIHSHEERRVNSWKAYRAYVDRNYSKRDKV